MYLKIYLTALILFLIIDALWLGVVAKKLYQDKIGFLMKINVNWVATIVFYLLFVIGIIVFVINPALDSGQWTQALLLGAFFGFITYATYDLTNLATLQGWSTIVTIIDILWGTFVVAAVSITTYFIATNFGW